MAKQHQLVLIRSMHQLEQLAEHDPELVKYEPATYQQLCVAACVRLGCLSRAGAFRKRHKLSFASELPKWRACWRALMDYTASRIEHDGCAEDDAFDDLLSAINESRADASSHDLEWLDTRLRMSAGEIASRAKESASNGPNVSTPAERLDAVANDEAFGELDDDDLKAMRDN